MNQIVAIVMETLRSSFFLVVLFSVHTAHARTALQGLTCVSDLVSNVSCTWNKPRVDPGVNCWIFGLKIFYTFEDGRLSRRLISGSCELRQHGDSPPGCSFTFGKKELNPFEVMPNISLVCDGTLVEKLEGFKPNSHIKMNPPGVPNVNSTANDTLISWSPGSPLSIYLKERVFQLQIKLSHTTLNVTTHVPEYEIPSWRLTGNCKLRVRVKPTDRENSQWSDWSPTTSWVGGAPSPADRTSSNGLIQAVMFSSAFVLIVILALYSSLMRKGLLNRKPVPSPSTYFQTLHSDHNGNLKKWLNPPSASAPFFTDQPLDHISPLRVCESLDVVPSTSPSSTTPSVLLHCETYLTADSDTSGVVDHLSSTASSGFSNMDYFVSGSSGGSVQTHPGPAYFAYQDDFHHPHNSHTFHLSLHVCPPSPTYESLKRLPHSPDSGFCTGNDEEEVLEDKSDVIVEEEEVSDHSLLLVLPLHLPAQACPPSSPPCLADVSSGSQQEDQPVADVDDGCAGWPVAGAMHRSSSMPVESFSTGYFTLKDLQTTFSNASI